MQVHKRFTRFLAALLVGTFLFAGCYGSFTLTKKLYSWNGGLGDKFVNTAVMWVLVILPGYEIAGILDFAIFNTLEFWTGSNPLALKEGEKETQVVTRYGRDYYITAQSNRLDVSTVNENGQVETGSLVFDNEAAAFYAESPALGRVMVSRLDTRHPGMVNLLAADGHVARTVDLNN